jgi:uncharacterized protein (TIGR02391 family)
VLGAGVRRRLSIVADKLPAPTDLVTLPEDVVGLMLLRLIVEDQQGHLLTRSAVANTAYWAQEFGQEDGTRPDLIEAMAEAWDWLHQHGLVALRPGTGSPDGWAFVTRRGCRVIKASEPLSLLRAEERINVELHPSIAEDVRAQFLLGKYEFAALAALKQVEIRVREMARARDGDVGVPLMRQAFKPSGGPLTDPNQEAGEQEATSALFAGAIGVFKNPSSHREVEYDDPTFAAEVVLLGDLLLRMLDQVAIRLARKSSS